MLETVKMWVQRDGARLWAEVFFARGPTCLFINGAGAISAFWPDELCERLVAEGIQVIRYDHRDSGNSSFVDFASQPYTLMDLVEDALAVLDARAVRSAHLVGQSMGGFIAQLAAIHHPERVSSLTSISSHTATPGLPDPPPETWEVMLANKPVGEIEADLDGFMTVWRTLNGEAPFDAAMAEAYTRELYSRNQKTLPATNHVAIQEGMADRAPDLAELRLPALVIHGTRDPLVPIEGAHQTAEAIQGAQLVVLPGAGHMFFDGGVWDAIGRDLTAFFERAEAQ